MITHSLAIATVLSLLFGGSAGGCHTKSQTNKSSNSQKEKEPAVQDENAGTDLKVVAEGFHSSIETPFIAVIRDEATLSELAKRDRTLPKLDADFKTNILIAAFLGERNTGGYSVDV